MRARPGGGLSPSGQIAQFLDFVDAAGREHKLAQERVAEADKRLIDIVHEMEFAADKAERNRIATKLQRSRRERRESKDVIKELESVVRFFEGGHKATVDKMRQLLERQRAQEEYLNGERVYKPRARK